MRAACRHPLLRGEPSLPAMPGVGLPQPAGNRDARAHRKAARVRQYIEQRGGSVDHNFPVKPKGMHRQTFLRLRVVHEHWMALYFTGETRRLEAMLKRLESM